MTLKEITDLLDVRHNDAMKVVERMSESREFGLVVKITTKQKTGFGERDLKTYAFDKRQSIAVAGRLNVDLQMRVIDRWLELEESIKSPMTLGQMTLAVIQGQQQKGEQELC